MSVAASIDLIHHHRAPTLTPRPIAADAGYADAVDAVRTTAPARSSTMHDRAYANCKRTGCSTGKQVGAGHRAGCTLVLWPFTQSPLTTWIGVDGRRGPADRGAGRPNTNRGCVGTVAGLWGCAPSIRLAAWGAGQPRSDTPRSLVPMSLQSILRSLTPKRVPVLVPVAYLAGVIIFSSYIFPWRTATLMRMSGVEDPVLDGRMFGYSTQEASDVLMGLGSPGRKFYAITELTLDLMFPVVYSMCLSLFILWGTQQVLATRSRGHALAFLPIAVLFLDYAENGLIIVMLIGFPETLVIAPVASMVTTAKWGTGIITLLVCLGWILAGGLHRFFTLLRHEAGR